MAWHFRIFAIRVWFYIFMHHMEQVHPSVGQETRLYPSILNSSWAQSRTDSWLPAQGPFSPSPLLIEPRFCSEMCFRRSGDPSSPKGKLIMLHQSWKSNPLSGDLFRNRWWNYILWDLRKSLPRDIWEGFLALKKHLHEYTHEKQALSVISSPRDTWRCGSHLETIRNTGGKAIQSCYLHFL